jgi:hypothetical protein
MDTAIKNIDERYTFLSQDKETRELYDRRQMARMDWNNVINERDRNAYERDQERSARLEAERRIAELEAQIRKQ